MATKTCVICGKQYKACVDCAKYGGWKALCDTPDHYRIYEIIQQDRLGTSKEDLQEMLSQIPKSSLEGILPEVSDYLEKEILAAQTKRKKVKSKETVEEITSGEKVSGDTNAD
jgi:hypothetical protein